MPRQAGWLASVLLAIAALAVVVGNIVLSISNQSAAASIAERRAYVAQGPQLSRVVQVVATGLAQAAVRSKDTAIRTLLTENGIGIQEATPPAVASPATPDVTAAKPPAP